jgi:nicotinamide riboside kinase
MKVVITGIECSGKSTLAAGLADHYGVSYIPEYARTYLTKYGPDYTESDLLTIAKGQVRQEKAAREAGVNPIICDSSLLVIKIWSEIRFGRCDPWITDYIKQQDWDLFILCDHHISLEPDPLRDYDLDREEFHERYRTGLQELGVPYIEVKGPLSDRIKAAIETMATYK